MRIFKKLGLLFLLCFVCGLVNAQNLNWLLGTWNGTASNINNAQSVRTIIIDSVSGENFSGTRISELKGSVHAKIITAVSGYIEKEHIHIKNGNILYKKAPPRVELTDCSSCIPEAAISIQQDRIVVTSIISGCQPACNGTVVYYKLFCDFDTLTQRNLINRFGNAGDIANFKPCIKKTPEMIAEEKRMEQAIADSLNLVKLNEAQRLKDSAVNAEALARQREKEITDSISVVKKREKEMQDSTTAANKIAQQKEAQRIKDAAIAATALANQRKKEIADSTSLIKKREKEIQDSTISANKIAQQKEEQRIKDAAIAATALANQRKKAIVDSTSLVKKREKEIQDSTIAANKIAQQKEEQRIKDAAIAATALANQRKKEIADSTSVAKKREKQIEDSTTAANNVARQKEQQRVKDSLANAAAVAAIPLAVKDKDTAKASTIKALETRENVMLETYHIGTPDILIELFDNAQIDGDRVSVYHNNTLIVNNKMLTKEPIIMRIHADASIRTHEFIMIAENLGTIAPNTALMRVTAGSKTYKLSVKTDLQTNAKIVFYYDGN